MEGGVHTPWNNSKWVTTTTEGSQWGAAVVWIFLPTQRRCSSVRTTSSFCCLQRSGWWCAWTGVALVSSSLSLSLSAKSATMHEQSGPLRSSSTSNDDGSALAGSIGAKNHPRKKNASRSCRPFRNEGGGRWMDYGWLTPVFRSLYSQAVILFFFFFSLSFHALRFENGVRVGKEWDASSRVHA